jgi:hypothetical protein
MLSHRHRPVDVNADIIAGRNVGIVFARAFFWKKER